MKLTITNSDFCLANRSKWLQRLDDRWWWPLKGVEIVKPSLFNQSLELTLSSRRTSPDRHPIAKAIIRKAPANILTTDRKTTAQIRRSLNLLFKKMSHRHMPHFRQSFARWAASSNYRSCTQTIPLINRHLIENNQLILTSGFSWKIRPPTACWLSFSIFLSPQSK